ncbi:MAG: hypothetical protein KDE00_13595 [Rhodobacteraceae bacterium]|nr:hypothetical protein [Paracoccaceae bacterium]
MTPKIAFSALALLIAAPAFAAPSQLELSAGAQAGAYTQAQLVAITAAETEAEAARLRAFFAAENGADTMRNDAAFVGHQSTPVTRVNAGEGDRS